MGELRQKVILYAAINGICTRCLNNLSETGKRFCPRCLKYKHDQKVKLGYVSGKVPYKPRKG